ncbi:MAG: L,D-transpeptidase [Pseudomonadota bacterium]
MSHLNRRLFLATGAATLASPPLLASTVTPYVIPKHHEARVVRVKEGFRPGDIHVDPGQFALYFILEERKAMRYPVGIGTEQRYVSGTFRVARKAEWPRWTPTKAMIRREPQIYAKHAGGMPGGPGNPLGARSLYLYRGSRDSLLRIHGTHNPRSVGQRISNGCVRMINDHVIDLYDRVPRGTRVVLH